MPTATVTSKGQITIPKEIRAALELEDGDRVAFRLREDGVVEMEPETVDVRSLAGVVKSRVRGVSVEDMERAIRERGGRQ
jgi:AbrB family looped-hinge helix DNA binding protein